MPRFPMNMPRAGTATISPYGSTRFRRGIVGSHDVGEKRLHLAGEPFDLPVALLVWPDQIHDDVAYARLVEGAHLRGHGLDRTSTRLNSSNYCASRMPSSA